MSKSLADSKFAKPIKLVLNQKSQKTIIFLNTNKTYFQTIIEKIAPSLNDDNFFFKKSHSDQIFCRFTVHMANTTGYNPKMPENCHISQYKLHLYLKMIIDEKIATPSNNDNFFFKSTYSGHFFCRFILDIVHSVDSIPKIPENCIISQSQ